MIEEVMHNEDRALGNLQPEQDDPETIIGGSDGLKKSDTKSLKLPQVRGFLKYLPR